MTRLTTPFALGLALLAAPAAAQDAPEAEAKAETKTEVKIEQSADAPATDSVKALAEEVRRLKLEIGIPDVDYRQHAGMGPAASKVYFVPRGLSIGGYGETLITFFPDAKGKNETDLLRAIVYTGYRFSDRFVFNSEIEFEHAHSTKKGEVAVEFAYLDFIINDALTIRAGNVLVPMGFINEVHEPVFFHGVIRPDLERNLIPSTWNENGVGVYGQAFGLRYKAYVMNGLQAISNKKCISDDKGTPDKADDVKLCDNGNDGFGAGSWIRGGRQRGSKAIAENFAGVASVAYDHDLFSAGASGYFGRSGQDQKVNGLIEGEVLLVEAHAAARWKGAQVKAIGTMGTLSDADRISSKQGSVVGSRVQGGYVEAAYEVFQHVFPEGEQALSPFVRFEQMNLHHRVPEGFARDRKLATSTLTAGLTYLPHPNVAVKADFQRRTNAVDGDTGTNQINVGIGFVY